MRVAHFTGLRQIALSEAPVPRLQRPGDVLVRIDRVGVCGSDVHYYTHGRIGDQVLHYPATLGHECSGTIEAVGEAVGSLRPGDRVAIEPALVCGSCDQCRQGRENTCRKLKFLGVPGEAPGAVADFHVLPAENCFPLPPQLSLDEAVLAEPLAVGLHAVRLAGQVAGRSIAIFGAGPIGLSVLLCAKAQGDCRAYVTEPLAARREAARHCGADWVGDPAGEDAIAAIARQQPLGLDFAFECSGDPTCIDPAQALLKPGGTLILVGIPESDRVDFNVHVMRRKELSFKNVRRQRGCTGPVIALMADGKIDVRPLLTHCFPLARIQEAFELVAGYREGVIKALVDLRQPDA